jgi:hypothetical protein
MRDAFHRSRPQSKPGGLRVPILGRGKVQYASKHHKLDLAVFKRAGRENVASHLFNRRPIDEEVPLRLFLCRELGFQATSLTCVPVRDLKRDRLRPFADLLFGWLGVLPHMLFLYDASMKKPPGHDAVRLQKCDCRSPSSAAVTPTPAVRVSSTRVRRLCRDAPGGQRADTSDNSCAMARDTSVRKAERRSEERCVAEYASPGLSAPAALIGRALRDAQH